MNRSVAVFGTRGYPSYYGGFETLVRQLAPYLVEAGWAVRVYGRHGSLKPNDIHIDPRVDSVITAGLESKSLSTLSYGFTSTMHALVHKPDVALIMNVANGFWLPVLKARGIPTLVNVDGIEWERAKWGPLARTMFKAGAALTARFADQLVCDAEAIVDRWVQDYGVRGVFIPYGGAEPKELNCPDGLTKGKYALMVARFVPENTIGEFIKAAERVSEDWDVVVVGSSGYGGEIDDRMRRLAESHDRVTWLGHLDDDAKLFALWQNAGAYFHGHSVGGTNPALVQAMACGTPTIARDTIYNREVLNEAGIFVPPDPTAIADAILDLLNDSAKQHTLRSSALLRSRTLYTWASVCESYDMALGALLPLTKLDASN